jgi:peptidoglycan/LPS O-acetylase OafA/YrhL
VELCAAITAAALSYLVIERPFLLLRRRWSVPERTAAVPAHAEAAPALGVQEVALS